MIRYLVSDGILFPANAGLDRLRGTDPRAAIYFVEDVVAERMLDMRFPWWTCGVLYGYGGDVLAHCEIVICAGNPLICGRVFVASIS